MTPCNNTTVSSSIDSPRDLLGKNDDNSNPQQGTGLVNMEPTVNDNKKEAETNGAGDDGTMKTTNSSTTGSVRPNNNNNTMRSPPTKKDSRKLFVGGLPADVTEEEFRVFFEQFGEIVDSVVMFDRETHRSRGFGFVTFQSMDVANRLLDMGQDQDENGGATSKADDSTKKSPRVGRLVMRGKTCEVKAAEPKELSARSNRRPYYQNPGGSSSGGAAPPTATARRFVDKAYPQVVNHAVTPPRGVVQPVLAGGGVPHVGAVAATPYHDPHYMAAANHHHYPMVSPSYYPAYHPGMYHGGAVAGGGYHPGPMYANTAASPVHNADHHHGVHLPYAAVPPVIATPVDGSAHPYSMETAAVAAAVAAQEHGHAYPPSGAATGVVYGHPPMMHHQAYHHPSVMPPPHPLKGSHPHTVAASAATTAYPAPGTPASAMHPAAPGLPTKDE